MNTNSTALYNNLPPHKRKRIRTLNNYSNDYREKLN